jgi:hypothetical protein
MTELTFGDYALSTSITRVLSSSEYLTLGDEAVAKGYYRNDRRILLPGMAWEMDWIFDPTGLRQASGKNVMIKSRDAPNAEHLSVYYWRDWADKRPPLCLVCPNGEIWEPDRVSSNGPGWQVAGIYPHITCRPSIVVTGYHGWLTDGQFSGNLEGRGSHGIARPLPEGLRT